MNEIFEKLGLYDLAAVLLSGICMVVVTLITVQYVWKIPTYRLLMLSNPLVFFTVCYLCGIIFQELGSALMRYFFKDDKLLKRTFDSEKSERKKDDKYVITDAEKKQLDELFSVIVKERVAEIYKYNFVKPIYRERKMV